MTWTLYISWTVWDVHCMSHFLMGTYIYCELREVYTVCPTIWCTVSISWTVWHFLCLMYRVWDWNSMIYSLCSTSKNMFVAKGLTFNFSDHRSERQLFVQRITYKPMGGNFFAPTGWYPQLSQNSKVFFFSFLPANNKCATVTESQWRGWVQMDT